MQLGDSLGAPLEFSSYHDREFNTVTDLSQPLFAGAKGRIAIELFHPSIVPSPSKELAKKGFARFRLKAGQWTDDTSMALCLADSLLQTYPDFKPMGTPKL